VQLAHIEQSPGLPLPKHVQLVPQDTTAQITQPLIQKNALLGVTVLRVRSTLKTALPVHSLSKNNSDEKQSALLAQQATTALIQANKLNPTTLKNVTLATIVPVTQLTLSNTTARPVVTARLALTYLNLVARALSQPKLTPKTIPFAGHAQLGNTASGQKTHTNQGIATQVITVTQGQLSRINIFVRLGLNVLVGHLRRIPV